MTTVADLAAWMERFAPKRLAESWDNVGLLLGDPASPVERVMTCLTVTSGTADEAIAGRAEAIVSHHPIFFKGTKDLRADQPETGHLWRLARAGVAVLSPHTSFDNTVNGINDGLARRFGLVEVAPLRVSPGEDWYKLVIFAPRAERSQIIEAATSAGAGELGEYTECSFTTTGIGTFRGSPASNPTIGKAGGDRESVRECRVELLCSGSRRTSVLAAIRAVHSYEEPAIDLIRVDPTWPQTEGSGRVGRLPAPAALGEFAARVARILQAPGTQFVGDPTRPVERVALCCGAGGDFLSDARRASADVFLTGETRYHQALEAAESGIGMIVVGHHASERPGVEDLAKILAREFASLQVWASEAERDPLQSLHSILD